MTIADDHPAVETPAAARAIGATRAAGFVLDPIDASVPGRHDYGGPLLADIRFEDWSTSALRRIADEVCLQGHLLALAFLAALRRRVDDEVAHRITHQQFVGAAGLAADRLRTAFGLGSGLDEVARLLRIHPALQPAAYVQAEVELEDRLRVRLPANSPAIADGGWWSLVTRDRLGALDAIVRALDPRYRSDVVDAGDAGISVEIVMDDEPAALAPEVAVARFSTGAEFRFQDRGTPVEVRVGAS